MSDEDSSILCFFVRECYVTTQYFKLTQLLTTGVQYESIGQGFDPIKSHNTAMHILMEVYSAVGNIQLLIFIVEEVHVNT